MKKAASSNKSIAFTTKGGKEIAFKATGSKAKRTATHVKQLEKRLSVMEKAVMQYNHAVQTHQAKRKEGSESVKCADGKSCEPTNKPQQGKKAVAVVAIKAPKVKV
jgi:hypothetical protein